MDEGTHDKKQWQVVRPNGVHYGPWMERSVDVEVAVNNVKTELSAAGASQQTIKILERTVTTTVGAPVVLTPEVVWPSAT